MTDNWNDWGMEFINKVDATVQLPGNEVVKEHWMLGEYEDCVVWIKEHFPEITEDQLEWVEEFLSEI